MHSATYIFMHSATYIFTVQCTQFILNWMFKALFVRVFALLSINFEFLAYIQITNKELEIKYWARRTHEQRVL